MRNHREQWLSLNRVKSEVAGETWGYVFLEIEWIPRSERQETEREGKLKSYTGESLILCQTQSY